MPKGLSSHGEDLRFVKRVPKKEGCSLLVHYWYYL